MKHIPGVDMSSGSLGQGISAAAGMALSAKLSNDDYRVYTLLGDGEIEEGQVWEAAMFAGFRKLDNLVVIVDNNGLQIDGDIADVCSPYPIDEKFRAFNFHVIDVADGNDMEQLRQGIGLQAYGQKDPLVEYKMNAYEMFNAMTASIQEDTLRLLYHVRVEQKAEREEVAKVTGTNKDESGPKEPKKRMEEKVYPNDPCPCGSGKKYKQCCGRRA